MFSAIYNWLFTSKKTQENGLDDKIMYERAFRLPFAWKCESSKKTISESVSMIKQNNQKLSKIHCDSDKIKFNASEYVNQSKSLSNKIKD